MSPSRNERMRDHQHVLGIITQRKKDTIHQLTTMLSTAKNVLFPGHNHLLTTGAGTWVIFKLSGHQHRWLAGDYDLEIGNF